MILSLVIITVLVLILAVLLVFAAYQLPPRRVGYIALPKRAVEKVIPTLKLEGKGVLYDLGCGDGRILAAALDKNPGIKAVGIEINPVVVAMARLGHLRRRNLRLVRGDIMKADISDARWVFTYLKTNQMAKLAPKLERELKPGTRLVACDFPVPGRKPKQKIKIGETWQLGQTLFVYVY